MPYKDWVFYLSNQSAGKQVQRFYIHASYALGKGWLAKELDTTFLHIINFSKLKKKAPKEGVDRSLESRALSTVRQKNLKTQI